MTKHRERHGKITSVNSNDIEKFLANRHVLNDLYSPQRARTNLFFATQVSPSDPLKKLMPEVRFSNERLFPLFDDWLQAYRKHDIFVHDEDGEGVVASSFRGIHKHNLTNHHYAQGIMSLADQPLSVTDSLRYFAGLNELHPELFNEANQEIIRNYHNKDLTREMIGSAGEEIFSIVAKLLLLSYNPMGRIQVYHDIDLPNLLSAYAYSTVIEDCIKMYDKERLDTLLSIIVKPRNTTGVKSLGQIIEEAKLGHCTSDLADYWLQLLKDFQQANSLIHTQLDISEIHQRLSGGGLEININHIESHVANSRRSLLSRIIDERQETEEDLLTVQFSRFGF